MFNIKFNVGSSFDKTDKATKVQSLDEIKVPANCTKEQQPFIQIYNSGRRVSSMTQDMDWSWWNGCVIIDVDSKHYYNDVRQFNADLLCDRLYYTLWSEFSYNFYAIQQSYSGTSYHVFFYYDVEKTETNIRKCTQLSRDYVIKAFNIAGAGDIISYNGVLDKCTDSPYQGIFISNRPINISCVIDNQSFGTFYECGGNIDDYELKTAYKHKGSDLDTTTGDVLFSVSGSISLTDKIGIEHRKRMALYLTLVALHKDKSVVDAVYADMMQHVVSSHNYQFLVGEPDNNRWFDKYDHYKHMVDADLLKLFGYSVERSFVPARLDTYRADVTYELNEDQHIADLSSIELKRDRINHVYAGCGTGKTYWAKHLGKTSRVCFVSPLTSINKDSFDGESSWLVIDNIFKDVAMHICDDIDGVRASKWNVCTTWESFCTYGMGDWRFDYIIVDEIHSIYMYDYRISSITRLKDALRDAASKAISTIIVMTGTPSNEVVELDTWNIKIEKKQRLIDADIVAYNDSYFGYICRDIKEWTRASKDNCAIVFKDTSNWTNEERFKTEGITDIGMFNSHYEDDVERIISKQDVDKQVTLFSVYGQAGINLYIKKYKKARLYILTNNALGIIQYANRVRNKEVIDKVVIPYKKEKISNDVMDANLAADTVDAYCRVDALNKLTHKQRMRMQDADVISIIKSKTVLRFTYGFVAGTLDVVDNAFVLNEHNYENWYMINETTKYEKQLQVVYNRLIDNYFNIHINYLDEDVKTLKSTKLMSNRLAGQMLNVKGNVVKISKEGRVYIVPTSQMLKYMTGDTKDKIESILNYMYEGDKDRLVEKYNYVMQTIISNCDTLKKKHIDDLALVYKYINNWNQYVDNAIIYKMLDDSVDDEFIAAAYFRYMWDDKLDVTDKQWHDMLEESYDKTRNVRKVVNTYKYVFNDLYDEMGVEAMDVENDEMMSMFYSYLKEHHTKGKAGGKIGGKTGGKAGKEITIDGVTYKTKKEAAEALGISRQMLDRRLKSKK